MKFKNTRLIKGWDYNMLTKYNFTEEYIRNLQSDSRRDPLLLERCVYAFELLEDITRVGMTFVFKDGDVMVGYCLKNKIEY